MYDYLDDEQEETLKESENEGFSIDDDLTADSIIELIGSFNDEIARHNTLVEQKINRIKYNLSIRTYALQKKIDFFSSALQGYFNTLDVKPNKSGNKIYRLNAGKLTYSRKKVLHWTEEEEKEMLTALSKAGLFDCIQTKSKVLKSELKKVMIIDEDKVINKDTGEVFDIGIEVKETFKVGK